VDEERPPVIGLSIARGIASLLSFDTRPGQLPNASCRNPVWRTFDAAIAEEGPNIPWEEAKADLGWD